MLTRLYKLQSLASKKWVKNTMAVATLAVVMALFIFPDVSFAKVPSSTSDITKKSLDSTVGKVIRNIVNFLAAIAGVFFVGKLIMDGIKLAFSSGNPGARAEAIHGILWSLVGCACALGAVLLVGVVLGWVS